MINDTIADLLTRIRNAMVLNSEFVLVSCTKVICAILEILKAENFIKKFTIIKIKFTYFIIILLFYKINKKCSNLKKIKRISKSSLRIFDTKIQKFTNIYNTFNRLSFYIMSTSYGIMTNYTAKTLQIGGEILFQIELIS